MKKIYLLVLSFIVLSQAPLFADSENIVVKSMAGHPQIQRGSQKLDVQTGMKLQTGDQVITPSAECTVDVSVNGLAGCRVLPTSEFVIVDGAKSSMHMQIKTGNAIMNLKKLPMGSTFQIETPTAVATVRGTQFWGRVQPISTTNPMTTFAVREGKVDVMDKISGKSYLLKKGQAIDIAKDGSIVPLIRPALNEEMKAMEQASSIKTSA